MLAAAPGLQAHAHSLPQPRLLWSVPFGRFFRHRCPPAGPPWLRIQVTMLYPCSALQILRRLKHANVVNLHDLYVTE